MSSRPERQDRAPRVRAEFPLLCPIKSIGHKNAGQAFNLPMPANGQRAHGSGSSTTSKAFRLLRPHR